jgi:hypothetical protein
MEQKRHNWRWWVLALTLGVAVVGAVWYGAERLPSLVAQRQLAAASENWTNRPFTRYRMELAHSNFAQMPPRHACHQHIEVSGSRVVRVLENTCVEAPKTIDDLLRYIREGRPYIHTWSALRSSLHIGCTDTTRVHISYHPTLGYPQEITTHQLSMPSWGAPDFWGVVIGTRGLPHACPNVFGTDRGGRRYIVQSLTPLP